MSEVRVGEIMVTQPICFRENDTIKDAAKIMVEQDISSGPVVDHEGHLVGVLTESDVMWKGAESPMDHFIVPPVFIGAFDLFFFLKDNKAVETEIRKILAQKVSEAMTTEARSVDPGTSIAEASKIMLQHRFNSLPVVQEDKVVGLISRHDVLKALIAKHSQYL
ncbi:hypothetical protein CEUSTIGMA_g545.t1 [Chlamydomonas eustigma]|uniref:CBS domain-containing protein n=1 Tax=Chlamydomonas eustigma TaxID=1157962 RepID=A0A250WQZ1_9CHLO|nr:hypothetical protein CEUSTIGMA_g545.t1 [Chlamydomonas eustigma]|eukprot:GAX73092.1 hypothetical protein CEUSTIGMA_g545.t1 [Chlamydomonas eustigma]